MASLNTNRGSGSESGGQLQVSLILRAYRERTQRIQKEHKANMYINLLTLFQ